MFKFLSRNLSTPECSSLHSRDETTEDYHPHRLQSSPSVPNLKWLRLPSPPTAERRAASPTRMYRGPTIDPNRLWDPGNERADRLAKSGSNCNPCPSPLTRKPKPCSETVNDANGGGPLETTPLLQTQSTVWEDMKGPLYSGCKQDTVACEHIGSTLASWTLHSAIAKKQNRRFTASPRTVLYGGNRDTSYSRRMSQPPTSCGERRRPAPHHPIPGNMWTEGLSTADRPQKKNKVCDL